MSPYYRPAIKLASDNIFYIQPPITSWDFSQKRETVVHHPPRGVRQYVLYNKVVGRELEIGGIVHKSTISAARTEIEALEAVFNGNAKGVFDFYYWHDRYFKGVACTAFSYTRGEGPSNILEWSASLVLPDPTIYNSPTIGAGPYESQVFGGDTEAPDPPSASPPQMAVFNPTIPNVYTGTGAVYAFDVTMPNTDQSKLYQIAFIGCTGFNNTAGQLVFRFNKSGLSDGTGIALTIDGTDAVDEVQVQTGSLVIDSGLGEKMYLVVDTNTAQPIDLQVAAYIESVT